MPLDRWQSPDIAGMLQRRDEETRGGAGVGPYEVPLGTPPMGQFNRNAESEGYVVDPDWAEVLNIGFDDLVVKHRR